VHFFETRDLLMVLALQHSELQKLYTRKELQGKKSDPAVSPNCGKMQDCDRVPVTPSTQLAYGKLHYDAQIAQIAQWTQTAKDGLPNHVFCNLRWVPHYRWGRR